MPVTPTGLMHDNMKPLCLVSMLNRLGQKGWGGGGEGGAAQADPEMQCSDKAEPFTLP
jgi:hypothetical protein